MPIIVVVPTSVPIIVLEYFINFLFTTLTN
jgi:hypothetical protein